MLKYIHLFKNYYLGISFIGIAASATSSLVYNVDFGIEGTIMAVVVMTIAGILIAAFYGKRNVKPYDQWTDV